MTRTVGERAGHLVLVPVIAGVAFGSIAACSHRQTLAQACDRVRVAEQDYAALRTHAGQPDFGTEVSVYARELDALAKQAAHVHNPELSVASEQARSAFAASRDDAARGAAAGGKLLADEQRFAYSMAEALAACAPGGRPPPSSTTRP